MCKENSILVSEIKTINLDEDAGLKFMRLIDRTFIENEEKMKEKFNLDFDMYNSRLCIIYHLADIDGHFIKILTELTVGKTNKNIKYFGCKTSADEAYEYLKEHEFDKIIICDLSFTKEIAEKIDKEFDTNKIILLDHHEQAEYLNDYNWAYVHSNDIYNDDITSGTILYRIFLYNVLKENKNDNFTDNSTTFETVLSLAVGAYDTWFTNDPKTKEISKEIFGDIGDNLNILLKYDSKNFDEKIINNIKNNFYFDDERIFDMMRILFSDIDMTIIECQKKTIQNSCLQAYNGMFIVETPKFTCSVVYIGDGYASQIGNFILEKQPEIDFVILVMPGIFTLSFRSRTDEFDVGKLAKLNNGGGHQPASGTNKVLKDCNTFRTMSLDSLLEELFVGKILDEDDFSKREIHHIKEFEFDHDNKKFIIE